MGNETSKTTNPPLNDDPCPEQGTVTPTKCSQCPMHCPPESSSKDKQGQHNQVESNGIKADNEEENRKLIPVNVLLKDDRLKSFVDDLLIGIRLKPNYIRLDDKPTNDTSSKDKPDDETIILVRHGSTRLDADIEGCSKHIADSDFKRTVIVIINEFGNNKKDIHGEIINPNEFTNHNINDLKCIVAINYKCFMTETKCKDCENAFEEFKNHVTSPNSKRLTGDTSEELSLCTGVNNDNEKLGLGHIPPSNVPFKDE